MPNIYRSWRDFRLTLLSGNGALLSLGGVLLSEARTLLSGTRARSCFLRKLPYQLRDIPSFSLTLP